MASRRAYGNHVAIEVRPGGFTVQHENRVRIGRPLIHVVHPQAAHIYVIRLKRVVEQALKTCVRGSYEIHNRYLTVQYVMRFGCRRSVTVVSRPIFLISIVQRIFMLMILWAGVPAHWGYP